MSRQSRGQNNSMSAASNRQNEYFVPRDGIDREVITADICRYLGNDALVRPGNYEADGRVIQGYYITAYRNLTSAMIADLKADSARWDQERRKHQMGGGTMISRDPSEVFLRNSNSPIVRYGDSQYRDQQMRGQSGYSGSAAMSSYDSVPRYPGSDAPGYSAGGTSSASYQPYGASQGFSGNSQYPSQQTGYPTPAADSRYAGASAGAPYGSGFGQQTMQDAPYVQGANYGVSQDYRQQDVRMQDAPGPSSRPVFSSGGTQAAYGTTSQGYPSYPQAQSSTQAGAPFTAQPVDAFYGRGAYTATPTTQASSDFVASPATNLGYSPAPPEQHGSTNPQRRERSDRDREDRTTTEKYSSRSSHHHRRG